MIQKKHKRGISLMIGYILLITIAIVLGAIVYAWMSTYIPTDPIDCPEGVSLSIQETLCDIDPGLLTLKLKNNGRFDLGGFFVRISNIQEKERASKDISQDLISGGTKSNNAILFLGGSNSLSPGEESTAIFDISSYGQIYLVEVIPARFQVEEGKTKFVNCGDAAVIEKISCSNLP